MAQVRALFGQLCDLAQRRVPPAPTRLNHCPADIGTEYLGTFYDGSRVLATFSYAASGCERVSVTAAGKTLSTMVYGRAAAAAPHLATDLDVVIVAAPKPGTMQPGGPNKPVSGSPFSRSKLRRGCAPWRAALPALDRRVPGLVPH